MIAALTICLQVLLPHYSKNIFALESCHTQLVAFFEQFVTMLLWEQV